MKKQYTEMITSVHKARKRTGMSFAELHERGLRITSEAPADQRGLRGALLAMEEAYETTDGTLHVFMPDAAFCTWLSESAKTLDPELGQKAAEGFAVPLVCLHFPCENKMPSALVTIGTGSMKGCIVLDISMSSVIGGAGCLMWLTGQDRDTHSIDGQLNPDEASPLEKRREQAALGEFYTRMIAGLGLYMGAFPEQVRDGIPADAKRADYAAGNAKTIGVSESVVTRDGAAPHYRSGHFRLYSDDRYINLKGQVRFVEGCFVHGQAKTVIAPEGEV